MELVPINPLQAAGCPKSGVEAIRRCAGILREGGLVALPTETVYGMGASIGHPQAVARVFELKGRPRFDPLIVHVPDLQAAQGLVKHFPRRAHRLAEHFWPGPLTLVLEKTDQVPDIVTSGLPFVGLRIPAHPMAQALLREAGIPVAAPSANPFGRTSPTTAEHVRLDFGDQLEILDGGPCIRGIESTVLSVPSGDGPVILLRPGAIPLEDIQEVVGEVVQGHCESQLSLPAPGMLDRHYATRTPLWLGEGRPEGTRLGWIGMGFPEKPETFQGVETLSPTGQMTEAAAGLFSALRRLDQLDLDVIWGRPVPNTGLGRAINDRLLRASTR